MEHSPHFGFNLPSRDADDIADINQISDNFRIIDESVPNNDEVEHLISMKANLQLKELPNIFSSAEVGIEGKGIYTLTNFFEIISDNSGTYYSIIFGENDIRLPALSPTNSIEYFEKLGFLVGKKYEIEMLLDNEGYPTIANSIKAIVDVEDKVDKTDIDQTFDPESENAQSGIAVAEAVLNANAPDEIIELTVNTPSWTTKATIVSGDGTEVTIGTLYYVTTKNTDGTALPTGQFKLTEQCDSHASALTTIYSMSSNAPYDRKPIEVVSMSADGVVFRDGGISGWGITPQKAYKKVNFYIVGQMNGFWGWGSNYVVVGGVDRSVIARISLNNQNSKTYSELTVVGGLDSATLPDYLLCNLYTKAVSTSGYDLGSKLKDKNVTDTSFTIYINTGSIILMNGMKLKVEVWYK